MRSALYQSRLMTALQAQNTWRVVAFIMVASNLLLSGWIVTHKSVERHTIIPPTIDRPFHQTGINFDRSYWQQVTEWFGMMILNYTPKSFDHSMNVFLKYVHPSAYGRVHSDLVEEKARIETRQLTSTFFPKDFAMRGLSNGHIQTALLGVKSAKVGKQVVDVGQSCWRFTFNIEPTGDINIMNSEECQYDDPFGIRAAQRAARAGAGN